MKAVILAGGKGTRLSEFTKEIPKPLIPINGKPVLEYGIDNFALYGIKDIIIVIGHLGHKIQEYLGDGTRLGVNISYYVETEPLGTAGALYHLRDSLSEEFVLVYGDVIFDIDLDRFICFHLGHGFTGTLAAHPNNHPYDSDVLQIRASGLVEDILKKNEKRDYYYNNCVNAGIFLFNKRIINYIAANTKQDLEKDIIAQLIPEGEICAYRTTEYMKDMGTPDRYSLVQQHVDKGIVGKKNLALKQRAIFIDRDGTINKYVGLLSKPEQLVIEDKVVEALRRINDSEFISIVITNQSVIARNLCSVEELDDIHRKLETLLGERGVYVDDIIYCPHHPDGGYPEENKALKISCRCRKPSIGMLESAAAKYNIDLASSYLIGDTTVDIQTGINANVSTVLVGTGLGGKDNLFQVAPNYYADHLLEAVDYIMK
ncbi:UTP--glucose-1-phosphate uridylyltransferase [Paenibacillus plantiphilus]|uniref:UTP--glucose-1-phosphate uridylyltransferase n=1 Tax=Paenibacillus plantiphilus TaxID=2905650 RepID=A0ABN8FPU8_9BACL|nr:HAD-IIIA family hydrolase [Paenibacillus plantiphilus]CAH1190037.1 UTP--glucose-1-phosphate uridylyltransferase [Paenibacillus plantiphilus]